MTPFQSNPVTYSICRMKQKLRYVKADQDFVFRKPKKEQVDADYERATREKDKAKQKWINTRMKEYLS